ncbi:hypothetical protein JB92DRAFT_2071761 [Gautieria morchelliformis]|nr:hypothetical protein JB92DRAFT_2071761 [Gautieria morchelliformis]
MILNSLVSRSSSSLLRYLTKLEPDPNNVLLFSVSAHAYNLEAIISRLRSSARHSIGCLSAPLPGAPGAVICSTAVFSLHYCVPFRSEIPGRAPIQVGRWNRKGTPVENMYELPDFSRSPLTWRDSQASEGGPQLPVGLRDRRDITTLLFLSDDAPEGLGRSLSHIPKADKLGLIASSTPFITGRPFTLFYDDRIYSSGAVGVGLRLPRRPTSTVNFHGLVPLSDPMKVSKSEGNLIHGLNHSSPSGMLVKALDADLRMAQKEDKFFLGHLRPGPPGGLEEVRHADPSPWRQIMHLVKGKWCSSSIKSPTVL